MSARAAGTINHVAVIGVGSMGQPMARHLHDAGYALTLCDTNAEALASLADVGAREVATPVECRDCDLVLILVATPEQLQAVATGEHGLSSMPSNRMPRYVVVGSTVAPEDMRTLAEAFAGLPTTIVDAPVSGGVVGARRRTLTFLVGGADADVEVLRAPFLAMGSTVLHCGPLGAGQTTKTINNIIAISNLMVSAEAYSIALANGLSLDALIPALEAGSARNFLSRDASTPPEVYAAWSGTEREFENVLGINQKDIDLALALSPPQLDLPAITALRHLLGRTGAETLDNWRRVAKAGE
jgi:3-hydroxyisobutyrate dehydrogenase-like beta-hydroxyacid dehydrogenase